MPEKSCFGERDHAGLIEHTLELTRRNGSSLFRNPVPVIVLEYDCTRRGDCREAVIKRGGTTVATLSSSG